MKGLLVVMTRDAKRASFYRDGRLFERCEVDPRLWPAAILRAWAHRMQDMGYSVAQELREGGE